ncbi:uncharacterized protein LOC764703 [Strongylocentrotus purpuratus]|uniref:Uncharacterized protein n=1 Tax=Strongylocentrotus purpuratus TaxID=7668 RepID=A0A7M7GA76_STRPU|nr:uncharacterized protein LOC764703 [Strongylocentrotus purpuratus]|eukprot:XP_001201153.1 PREDICTED: uncharacterized protein LOC764703 [Strongylocentrotus purpuratus]
MPCFLSTIQSPIQAFLRPAVWIPGLNRLHSHREQWVSLSGTADQLVDDLIQAVDRVAESDPKTTYAVKQVDREKHKVQIYNWTWAEWLDVVEIEFRDGANGGVEAKCFSFSSGFLPTWFPLCFLFNVLFFWLPFYDNKFNSTRLERLRVTMATECRLVPKKDQESNETTPIVSDKRSPTSSPPRQTSPTSTEATPTETKHDAMATEHSQEEAMPTNMDKPPAKNEASTGFEGTDSDEALRTSRSVPSTEPVNA